MSNTVPTKAKPGAFADLRRGSRQSRGYGAAWDNLRAHVMTRDAGLCQPCSEQGRVTQAKAVDHIVPKANGGTDDTDNLQAICNECHTAKTVLEAMVARGLTAPGPRPACTAAGLPTDPAHPWNQQGRGGEIFAALPLRTDLEPSLAKPRNSMGGAS